MRAVTWSLRAHWKNGRVVSTAAIIELPVAKLARESKSKRGRRFLRSVKTAKRNYCLFITILLKEVFQ